MSGNKPVVIVSDDEDITEIKAPQVEMIYYMYDRLSSKLPQQVRRKQASTKGAQGAIVILDDDDQPRHQAQSSGAATQNRSVVDLSRIPEIVETGEDSIMIICMIVHM